jgi:hypothetical protein
VGAKAELDRIYALALEKGATPVKPPFSHHYDDANHTHWHLAILLDPEGNAFRLSAPAG